MEQIRIVGLDIAKSVFQVHGVDGESTVVVRRRLKRSQVLRYFASIEPCRIGIEACATAHFWARELGALGHDVKLMPPAYVKPYVRRQKNDAADAEAICEAVTRPTMRFVPVKKVEQQGVMVLHRTREMLMGQRVRLSNAIRGHMAEFAAGRLVFSGIRIRNPRRSSNSLAASVQHAEATSRLPRPQPRS